MIEPRQRIVAHLDMDAFYASVELLRRPGLRGRPLVIGGRRLPADTSGEADRTDRPDHTDHSHGCHEKGTQGEQGRQGEQDGPMDGPVPILRDYTGRGVITTATYEARALGVHSGMGLMKAARLAPDALLLPADFDAYRHCSARFKAAVRARVPQVEDRGIDEIYIDFTDAVAEMQLTEAAPGTAGDDARCWTAARALAVDLQRAVLDATGLSCSIGVTPNKLLSKIASDLHKPGGITVLNTSDIAERIWPLPVRKINGIGPKADARLAELGIRTIGELAAADRDSLIAHFGSSQGAWLHEAAHGRDDRPVVTFSDPKSLSRETTFERDLHPVRDRGRLTGIFTDLCERLSADLQRKGYAGRTVGVKLRYEDFSQVTRDRTIDQPTQDARAIRRAGGDCLRRVPLDRRIRLLGVRIGGLVPADASQAASQATHEWGSPGTIRSLFD